MALGPSWGAVVLPFRRFTISLLFRMSCKISHACTKAAGEVRPRAVLQYVAGATAAAEILAASRVRPDTFLGPHGAWGAQQAQDLLRPTRLRRDRTSAAERLAPVREASPE